MPPPARPPAERLRDPANGRFADAARATHDNWSTLGRLLHLDDDDEAHSPTTEEGAPWPSPTSPATR
jgi:hypothetical protein